LRVCGLNEAFLLDQPPYRFDQEVEGVSFFLHNKPSKIGGKRHKRVPERQHDKVDKGIVGGHREGTAMIQISDPRESSPGISSVHDVAMDGEHIGCVNINYIQANEVKTYRKYTKRKLSVGQPYSAQVIIDATSGKVNAQTLGKEGLHALVVALKEKLKGLEERDVFILELNSRGKTIVGRGSEF